MVTRYRYSNDALTKAEVVKLLAAATDERDRILLQLGLYTGCRVNELASLDPSNIDYRSSTIRVWDQKKDTRKGKARPDKKFRTVDTPQDLLKAIKQYQERQKRAKWGTLFGLKYHTYESVLHRVAEKALGSPRSWHCLRHTYATQSLNSGRSIAYVARQMGDTEEMVVRVYHQLSPEQLAAERAIKIY